MDKVWVINIVNKKNKYNQSLIEEIGNSISHGFGFFLSIIGFIYLMIQISNGSNMWEIIGYTVYGFSLVILYSFSTVYHGLTNSRLKAIFRRLDHSAIYILIAGTYTPVILISLRSTWVIYLLPIIWLIAIIGIYMKIQFIHKYEKVSLWIYITMGWLALIAIKPLLIYLPLKSFVCIIAGGIIYTIGIAFYVRKKLPYHHVIWHIFVLIGSIFHYIGILYL